MKSKKKMTIKYDYGETEEVSEIINKITKEMIRMYERIEKVRHTSGDFEGLQRWFMNIYPELYMGLYVPFHGQ